MKPRRLKPMSSMLIKEAYSLIMKGYTPLSIRGALDITEIDWAIINQSKLYHQLIIQKDIKQCGIESKLNRLKGIELTLFSALERYHKEKLSTPYKAKLGMQIDQLKQEYAYLNIFN